MRERKLAYERDVVLRDFRSSVLATVDAVARAEGADVELALTHLQAQAAREAEVLLNAAANRQILARTHVTELWRAAQSNRRRGVRQAEKETP